MSTQCVIDSSAVKDLIKEANSLLSEGNKDGNDSCILSWEEKDEGNNKGIIFSEPAEFTIYVVEIFNSQKVH